MDLCRIELKCQSPQSWGWITLVSLVKRSLEWMLFFMCIFHKQISTMSVRLFQITANSVAERRLNKGCAWLWKLLKLLFSCRYWLLQGCFGITVMTQRCHPTSCNAVYPSALTVFSWLCAGMKGKETSLDLMIGCIILILQRLLLVLVTFCTIYVVCKSSDPHCVPNNSQAVCLSCSSLSLLLWKQVVPNFIGSILVFSVIWLRCIRNWESRHCSL